MSPEQFQQLRSLFDAALEREPATREAFVQEACRDDERLAREVNRLLVAHALKTKVIPGFVGAEYGGRTDPRAREGTRVGSYEILRELGRGGMGRVYLAKRADGTFQKNVAIKFLRSDIATPEFVRIFLREREVLAALDHPNITRLLDAGTDSEGLPYFVMEYVAGKPLSTYCDEEQLPILERVRLCRVMCVAVQYAHQRGVVHRDLKPGNILVTAEGEIKILDFGIARLIASSTSEPAHVTETNLMMLTPQYASPEQVRGEPASRQSDVYALGVILYEVLTAHSPYNLRSRIYHEIVRVICEEQPTRPSQVVSTHVDVEVAGSEAVTLSPAVAARLRQASVEEWEAQLCGDLDAILLKALAKNPIDRYDSVAQFAEDLDRHLSGEPVWANGISWVDWTIKRLSRHRALTTGITTGAIAIFTGAISFHWSAIVYAVAGVLALVFWYIATDREIGGRLAASPFMTRPAIIFLAVVWMPASILVSTWLLDFSVWVTGTRVTGVIDPYHMIFVLHHLFMAGLAVLGMGFVAAWWLRERWAGPSLANITQSNYWWVPVSGLALFGILLGLYHRLHEAGRSWVELAGNNSTMPILAIVLYLTGRVEIRQAGILTGAHLLRWSRIASWSWEDTNLPTQRRKAVLRIVVHRRLQFLPPVRLRIPVSAREEVSALMARHLGEWPQ